MRNYSLTSVNNMYIKEKKIPKLTRLSNSPPPAGRAAQASEACLSFIKY